MLNYSWNSTRNSPYHTQRFVRCGECYTHSVRTGHIVVCQVSFPILDFISCHHTRHFIHFILLGHCETCGSIRALQKSQTDKSTQAYCSMAHLMHRALFMSERQMYMMRRLCAQTLENRNNPRIVSMIIGILQNIYIF